MNAMTAYRLNQVPIQSLDAFLEHTNDKGDVVFVRALGEPPNVAETVRSLDQTMAERMRGGQCMYLRLPEELPKFTSLEDTTFYAKAYDSWRAGGGISLQTACANPQFSQVLGQATQEVLNRYQEIKAGVTETILKNFAAKLWFWTDRLLQALLPQWAQGRCVKVAADNVQKEQPYLFCYLLTLLGCDVLLLNTRGDINTKEHLKALSAPLALGPFGNSTLPSFLSPPPEPRKPVRLAHPDRPSASPSRPVHTQRSAPVRQAAPTRQAAPARQTAPVQRTASPSPLQEKSFEELASLASSIVMIAVHDDKGEPVATGSGIMIGRKGFILTNCHVVRGGCFFSVRIEDDEQVYSTNEVIKYNSNLDLAVIRIQRELSALPLYNGRKPLVRGQKVVAIGSPLGLFNSVSDGIISGFREIDGVDMIQFTAPISHGSSGGAVLNMAGDVIGISTAGIDRGQNINLAVGYESIRLFAKGFY